MSTGASETSVFHALSRGKTGQPPIIGLPAKASPPGAPPRSAGAAARDAAAASVRTVTRRAFAQRLLRHGRTE